MTRLPNRHNQIIGQLDNMSHERHKRDFENYVDELKDIIDFATQLLAEAAKDAE